MPTANAICKPVWMSFKNGSKKYSACRARNIRDAARQERVQPCPKAIFRVSKDVFSKTQFIFSWILSLNRRNCVLPYRTLNAQHMIHEPEPLVSRVERACLFFLQAPWPMKSPQLCLPPITRTRYTSDTTSPSTFTRMKSFLWIQVYLCSRGIFSCAFS